VASLQNLVSSPLIGPSILLSIHFSNPLTYMRLLMSEAELYPEEWRLEGCYAVWLCYETTFRRNLAPPSTTQRTSVASYGYAPSSPILFTLLMVALSSSETSVLIRATRRTSYKTLFFIVTAVKPSNLTKFYPYTKRQAKFYHCIF
jgi:hypothetical protein